MSHALRMVKLTLDAPSGLLPTRSPRRIRSRAALAHTKMQARQSFVSFISGDAPVILA